MATLPYLLVHSNGLTGVCPSRSMPRGRNQMLLWMSSNQSMFRPTSTPWPLSFQSTREQASDDAADHTPTNATTNEA